MKLTKLSIFLGFLFIGLLATSCGERDDDTVEPQPSNNTVEPQSSNNFDRGAMLRFWADDVIIPALTSFDTKLNLFVAAKNAYIADPSTENLENLKANWLDSYKGWQRVSMFDIGKAEAIGYRKFMNIYPTDVTLIEEHIASGEYNLELPSTFDAQGFPAIDYLLFGMLPEIPLDLMTQDKYNAYLSDLVDRMQTLNSEVLNDWQANYRDIFVNNNGSSGTASTDKLTNDFLFYFESNFRAGKIGIPAGIFSGTSISTSVEAPYSGVYSKVLFDEAFDAIHDFFTGIGFDKTTTGKSLQQYLGNVAQNNETQDFSIAILQQWGVARNSADNLLDSFKDQVEQDNDQMLNLHDELQASVRILKVDMMSALNIQVDFVDADGD